MKDIINDIRFAEDRDSFIKELKKIEWTHWLNRPYSVFMATICWEGVREKFYSRSGLHGLGADNYLYQFPDIYYDVKFYEKGVTFFDNYFKSHKMSDLSNILDITHKRHVVSLGEIINDNNKTIPQKIALVSDMVKDYLFYLNVIPNLEEYFNKRIATEVPKYIQGDYSRFVGDMCIPTKKNAYVLMLEELMSGVPIKEIKNKYGWMRSRDGFTDFYTEEDFEEIKRGFKEPQKHEVIIPEELKDLAKELKELNFFRTDRTDKFYEFHGIARPLFEETAKHIGVSFKDLADYDANSIITGQPKRYNKNFSYGLIDNKYIVSNEPLISDFKKHKSDEVKGRTAFKGVVRGIARIVTHSNDIDKVKEGDILIAQMTFPSFISAMQKSAAFVTDEGSITCHAAIIAREMKKPCIIGTKNATHVLKDGDMVEVDADKGIVRIIK
ncbi:MAG: PEP-utilizing enzyme [Candidatus Paceibacterota bacterium]|jgi:phosphohistidine swiveling domain-containing protein